MITENQKLEILKELKNGFTSFYHFSLSLVETINEKNGYLKFAVVNMQIALELFLKYYFIRKDMPERVFINLKGKRKFRDFSEVLNSYYSVVRKGHYADKKHLTVIMESRNDIVHKGKYNEWDEDLANYIINCAFFMQGILRNEFSETLLSPEYHPHNLSYNQIWRNGAIAFAKKACENFNEIVLECPYCSSRALVPKEIFEFDDRGSVENLQCLACLCEVEIEMNGTLIECCACGKKAFYVDKFNIQQDKTHFGGCFNCGNKMDLRQCDTCEEFYFIDLQEIAIVENGNFFCSQSCKEIFAERK